MPTIQIPDDVAKPPTADRLAHAIVLTGLSRAEFARRCGYSPATITAWCGGYRTPSTAQIDRLANKLGVTQSWLLGFDDGIEL